MIVLLRFFSLLIILASEGLINPSDVYAQAVLRTDSSAITDLKQMDAVYIDSVKNEKAFQYDTQEMRRVSAWDRFWQWVSYQIDRFFAREGYALGFKILIWALVITVIAFAVTKLVGMEKISFWIKGHKSALTEGEVDEDNIYGIDFDSEIAAAESRSAYREAVRFLYLKSLRLLADRSFINWKINKTNIEYAAELSDIKYRNDFQLLTRYYEYAWYGEFDLNKDDYSKVSQSFVRFNKTVAG